MIYRVAPYVGRWFLSTSRHHDDCESWPLPDGDDVDAIVVQAGQRRKRWGWSVRVAVADGEAMIVTPFPMHAGDPVLVCNRNGRVDIARTTRGHEIDIRRMPSPQSWAKARAYIRDALQRRNHA